MPVGYALLGKLCPGGLWHLELQYVVKRYAAADGMATLPGSVCTLTI
jgi:hypothetical protein